MTYSRGDPSGALMVLVTVMPSLAEYQAFWPSRSMTFRPAPATWAGFRFAGGSARAAPAAIHAAASAAAATCFLIAVPSLFPAVPLARREHFSWPLRVV